MPAGCLPDLDSTAVLSLFISCLASILLLVVGLITRLPLLLTLALSVGALVVGVIMYRYKQKAVEEKYDDLETFINISGTWSDFVYIKGKLEFRFFILEKGNLLKILVSNIGKQTRGHRQPYTHGALEKYHGKV